MKSIIRDGEISKLISDSGKAGWSGEVYLIRHNGNKYVLRRCKELKKAKGYEFISKEFEKYGFLPKFLGRCGKDILYEYIDGRDLSKKESIYTIKQIGKIAAHINKIKGKGEISKRFYKQLKEVVSGKFPDKKVKPILKKEQADKIVIIYEYLKRRTKPELSWDINDVNSDNFRLKKGKVYLVDVEGIKPRIKGFGIGKAFIKWFKTPIQRKAFIDGYKSVSSTKFITQEYLDFIFLNFMVQEVNYMAYYGPKYKPRNKMRFEELTKLIDKYCWLK